MDILQQIDRLLCDMERSERERKAEEEINMGLLLQQASKQYVEFLRLRQWSSAQDRLVGIRQLVKRMMEKLPRD